jgi:5-methylcytosine-specific restriction endonuclease McrA
VASHIDQTVLVTRRLTKSSFRREIINAWDGACAYCGCRPEKVTLDHVIPKAKGGTTDRANLVPACSSCNVSKNHCDVWVWYKNQAFYCVKKEAKIKIWLSSSD